MMSNGWQTIKLGEVLTERRETPSPEGIETGEISIVSKIGFKKGKIEFRNETNTKTGMILIRPGDLVISGINAAKGAIAIYSEAERKSIAATIHYSAYIPNRERVDIKYLWWFLRSAAFRDIVQHHIPGGIKTELKAKRLLAVPVPMPPLLEQRVIVNRIEALASRVAEAQSLRRDASEELKFYKASLLNIAFAGKLIPNEAEPENNFKSGVVLLEKILEERKELTENGKDEIPPLPNPELLPILPKSWIWVTLEHICSRVTDGFHNTPKPTESGFPYVLATHVKSEGIDFDNCFYVSEADHASLYAKTQVKRGDILMVSIGAGSGTPVIVNVDFEFSFKNVAILKRLSQIDEKYMFFYLLFKRAELFKEITKGGAQPFLSLKSIRTIPFPLAPLSEQKRVVAYLETLFAQSGKVNRLQTEIQNELDALMPSVLDKAFRAEL